MLGMLKNVGSSLKKGRMHGFRIEDHYSQVRGQVDSFLYPISKQHSTEYLKSRYNTDSLGQNLTESIAVRKCRHSWAQWEICPMQVSPLKVGSMLWLENRWPWMSDRTFSLVISGESLIVFGNIKIIQTACVRKLTMTTKWWMNWRGKSTDSSYKPTARVQRSYEGNRKQCR